ncbi:MAG: hypothetical protein ABIR70_06945 [Bryobacteraceae bacterium]
MLRFSSSIAAILLLAASLHADTKKLSQDQRREIVRGLTAEWAKAIIVVPMAKKPLPFDSLGGWDEEAWRNENYKNGPAARPGDMVQITKVDVDEDKIKIELNDGSKKGSFWDRVQIGTGNQQVPMQRPKTNAMAGASIEIRFPESIGDIDSAGVKKILAKVLDFDKHTAIESYMDSLPEPIREAIKAQKVIEGMDREQVMLAIGSPLRKSREVIEDVDYEDYIYGRAPGIIRFVRFAGAKVSRIQEFYVGVNGSTADTGPIH